jgi:hypothetical protein
VWCARGWLRSSGCEGVEMASMEAGWEGGLCVVCVLGSV